MQLNNDNVDWMEDNNSVESLMICFEAACSLFSELLIPIDEYQIEAEEESDGTFILDSYY